MSQYHQAMHQIGHHILYIGTTRCQATTYNKHHAHMWHSKGYNRVYEETSRKSQLGHL